MGYNEGGEVMKLQIHDSRKLKKQRSTVKILEVIPYNEVLSLSDILKLYAENYSDGKMGHRLRCYVMCGLREIVAHGIITRVFVKYNEYIYVRTFGKTK